MTVQHLSTTKYAKARNGDIVEIIEDRGNIGINGRRLIRVKSDSYVVELPEDDLETYDLRVKQVIVWRNDLKCRLGKKMAQAGHAANAWMQQRILNGERPNLIEEAWMASNYRKIVLQVNSEAELLEIVEKARKLGLNTHLIEDEGLTEFPGPTKTCCAIGPDEDQKIDQVTRSLKML